MARGKSKAESGGADHNVAAKRRKPRKEKKAKDPNKPKRPASAFLVFMEEFRKQFKEENPENKSVAVVGKAGGDKWKSLTDEEKAPYLAKTAKRKQEYERQMQAYNKRLVQYIFTVFCELLSFLTLLVTSILMWFSVL
ncbi:OLC1v1016094C3 [Oldenlandia corymbosa var. corymbosa]|uniref:OLC1v1016094C3 n=1 Tax=Oldenlandia corymbosa var. corymbosa TaxID=529605 RepID=A0AAV1E501_OLDCO|nr:OLC1v1016094C3 [Oldenlandia corymbosa var. corymbosa]